MPYKSKNKFSTSQWKLMQQVVLYTVLRQICFPLSDYWTKLFLHPNVKSNTITTFFLLFFIVVYEAPWKSPKSNVCPYCCTLLRCTLCNYLDGLKKGEGEQLWNALCNRRWLHVNPCYQVPPSGQMPMSQCLAQMNDVILTPPLQQENAVELFTVWS